MKAAKRTAQLNIRVAPAMKYLLKTIQEKSYTGEARSESDILHKALAHYARTRVTWNIQYSAVSALIQSIE